MGPVNAAFTVARSDRVRVYGPGRLNQLEVHMHAVAHSSRPAWPSDNHLFNLVFITRVIDPERIAYSLKRFQHAPADPICMWCALADAEAGSVAQILDSLVASRVCQPQPDGTSCH